jgi:hypothetical protein
MPRIEHTPEATLKATQIIALALMAGVISTSAIMTFVVNNSVVGVSLAGNKVSLIMAGITVLNMLLLAVVARWKVPRRPGVRLHEVWQRRMVIRFALLEGTALLNAVAGIIERQWWTFVIFGVVFVLMCVLFPTRTRFNWFLETNALNQ